jgi:hypothetical protein
LDGISTAGFGQILEDLDSSKSMALKRMASERMADEILQSEPGMFGDRRGIVCPWDRTKSNPTSKIQNIASTS